MVPNGVGERGRALARHIAGIVLVFLAAVGLTLAVERSSLFFHVDRWMTDAVHAATAPRVRFDDVLIVDMNEQSMVALEPRLGPWPYSRDVFALVTDHLAELGARAVVFNFLFSDKREGDAAFADALQEMPNTWLAAQGQGFALREDPGYVRQIGALAWKPAEVPPLTGWRGFRLPHPGLTGIEIVRAGVGVVNMVADDDGMLRRVPLMHESGGNFLPALALAALFGPADRPNVRVGAGMLQIGEHRWPVDEAGNVLLQVPSNLDMFDGLTFDKVVESALDPTGGTLERHRVEGRTVFVGSTAAMMGDFSRIPIHGRMAGLDILTLAYANLANNLVLTPRSELWKILFSVIGALVPLLIASRRGVAEWMLPVVYGLGLGTAAALHVLLLRLYGIQSALLFPILLGAFTLLGQMAMRIKTIHDDRRRLHLDKLAADEANALKSQFLSHMTHELRTPLTAIMGYNRLLGDSDLSDEERKTQVGIINKNCEHLLALINNLLDQAKIEAGQMALDVGSVSVQELLDNVVDTLRPIADQKGLSVESRIAPDMPTGVRVDELRVRQILVNLGGNAIKFTSKGGVRFDVGWTHGRLEVKVRDTGPGMGKEALEKIFVAFQQADATVAKVHGGTGLGLTISRNLARLMGGDIDVRSEEGKGSTFTLNIPADGFEFPTRVAVASQTDEAAPRLEGSILVADDTEDLRQLLSLYLRKMGLKVLLAANGKEATEVAMAERPDLVFMDMQMPVMDGIEAVKTLREQGYTGTVLALTAQSDRDRIEATLIAGCDGYVEKPLSKERLEAIVRDRLAGEASTAAR